MKKLLLTITLIFTLFYTNAQVVYVKANASGLNDGTSWQDAYTDLQVALANTSSGEIWVCQGTYFPGVSVSSTFLMKNNVVMYGGFNGTETLLTQRNFRVNETILSGDLDLSSTYNAGDVYHVVTTGNTDSTAILDGFTISGGYANGSNDDANGAGIFSQPTANGIFNPVIKNCQITSNNSLNNGAGIYISSKVPGGSSNNPSILSCIIHSNASAGYSGGVYIVSEGSSNLAIVKIDNSLFYNNSSSSSGHHLGAQNLVTGQVHVKITACTFTDNIASYEILYLANGIAGSFEMNNNIFYGLDVYAENPFNANNNCGPLTYLSGAGNINMNPLYKNPGVRDYSLTCQSPCINTGNSTYTLHGLDLNDSIRISGVSVDMGAYETNYTIPTVLANSSLPSVCAGQDLILFGSGTPNVTYTWSNGVSDSILFTPNASATYTLTATALNGCYAEDTILVNYFSLPSVLANSNATNVCAGTMITLYGSGSAINYNWSGGVIDSSSFAAVSSQTYTLTGTDVNGCSDISTITINVEVPANFSAGADQYVCDNKTKTFITGSVAGSTSYTWSHLGAGTIADPNINPMMYNISSLDTAVGTVSIILDIQLNVCPSISDTMLIIFVPSPSIQTINDINVCEGDSVLLSVNFTGGTPPFTFDWLNGFGLPIHSGNNFMYTPMANDNLTISLVDSYGCYVSDEFNVAIDSSNNINGVVLQSGSPLSAGMVYLFKYNTLQVVLDTIANFQLTPIDNGVFNFTSVFSGNYLIKVLPDTSIYQNLLPTYYGNSFQWDSALVINHSCTNDFIANVDVIQLLSGTGSGIISGSVLEAVGFGARYAHLPNHIMVPGGPLKGIDVKLGKNPGGGIQARTMTDTTGKYFFDNLPDGSYTVYVDIPGLPMDSSYTVSLNSSVDSIVDLMFYADSNSIFPIVNSTVSLKPILSEYNSNTWVSPNPAKEYVDIIFESVTKGEYVVQLFDLSMTKLNETKYNLGVSDKNKFRINLDKNLVVPGVYILKLQGPSTCIIKKLVVE